MIDFKIIAKQAGYESAFKMWEDLYAIRKLGLNAIARHIGVNRNTITRQLRVNGITVRGQGGAHKGRGPNRMLESIPESRIRRSKISRLAAQLDLSPSTVYEYLRKKGLARKGKQFSPHPGYSRAKGASTPRPMTAEEVAEQVLEEFVTNEVLEEMLEEERGDKE